MFCMECGSELASSAKFCSKCGFSNVEENEINSTLSRRDLQATPAEKVQSNLAYDGGKALAQSWLKSAKEWKSRSLASKIRYSFFLLGITLLIFAKLSSGSHFDRTQSAKALRQCVSGSGQLNVEKASVENSYIATLTKGTAPPLSLQFQVDSSLDQAKLTGVSQAGEQSMSKFVLMLKLEMMCGGELASRILPDEYNSLKLMQSLIR